MRTKNTSKHSKSTECFVTMVKEYGMFNQNLPISAASTAIFKTRPCEQGNWDTWMVLDPWNQVY